MTHEMRLTEKPFNNIKNGTKKIELRLFDEKRRKINLNDYIIFHKVDHEDETIKVKVIGLIRYNSFEEMFNDIDITLTGTTNVLEDKINNLRKFYSEEEEKKYGVLGIRIEEIK